MDVWQKVTGRGSRALAGRGSFRSSGENRDRWKGGLSRRGILSMQPVRPPLSRDWLQLQHLSPHVVQTSCIWYKHKEWGWQPP